MLIKEEHVIIIHTFLLYELNKLGITNEDILFPLLCIMGCIKEHYTDDSCIFAETNKSLVSRNKIFFSS